MYSFQCVFVNWHICINRYKGVQGNYLIPILPVLVCVTLSFLTLQLSLLSISFFWVPHTPMGKSDNICKLQMLQNT